jgi:hypothetical protein
MSGKPPAIMTARRRWRRANRRGGWRQPVADPLDALFLSRLVLRDDRPDENCEKAAFFDGLVPRESD